MFSLHHIQRQIKAYLPLCLAKKKRLSQKGSLFFYEIFCNFSHEEKSKKEAGV
jgi:hypothetical protein